MKQSEEKPKKKKKWKVVECSIGDLETLLNTISSTDYEVHHIHTHLTFPARATFGKALKKGYALIAAWRYI